MALFQVAWRCAIGLNAARELNLYQNEDGCLVIRARLPAEASAIVLEALEAAMDTQRAEEDKAASEDVTAVTSAGENRFAKNRISPEFAFPNVACHASTGTSIRQTGEFQPNPHFFLDNGKRLEVGETSSLSDSGKPAPATGHDVSPSMNCENSSPWELMPSFW